MQISEHWFNQWVPYLCYHGDMDVCRPNENITCKEGHSSQCHCQPTWYHGQHFSATLHFRNASVILYVLSVIIYSVICHHIRCHSHHAMMPLLSYTVSLLSYTVLMSAYIVPILFYTAPQSSFTELMSAYTVQLLSYMASI